MKIARKKAGYSLRELSCALNGAVSAQAIGKYERREMMPSSDVLMQLGKVLGVSLHYLMSERVEKLEDVKFRKLSGLTSSEKARLSAEVIDKIQRELNIEEILGLDGGAWNIPKFENRFLGVEDEGEILSIDLREECRLGIDPIPNMTSQLEDQGVRVFMTELPKKVPGVSCWLRRSHKKRKVPVIVVNQNVTLESRRLTLARELAHLLIDKSSTVDHEKSADVFANAFLMPRVHLIREIGERRRKIGYQELIHVKSLYRVSAAALLLRLQQAGIFDESKVASAFKGFARGWRFNEPEPLEKPGEDKRRELPQRFERLCYHALAEGMISRVKASELLLQSPEQIEIGLRGPAEGDTNHRG